MTARKSRTEWSVEDLATLRREWGTTPKDELAHKLGRSISSTQMQAHVQGLTRKVRGKVILEGGPKLEKLTDAARANYTPTIGTEFLGDPPPGRSALDGWVQRGREEKPDPRTRSQPWHPLRDGLSRGACRQDLIFWGT